LITLVHEIIHIRIRLFEKGGIPFSNLIVNWELKNKV
jgi:hypothetical protein